MRGGPTLDTTTDFSGYDHTAGESRIAALLKNGIPVDQLAPGDEGEVVLERTPFYAESGGQVGDTGQITAAAQALQSAIRESGAWPSRISAGFRAHRCNWGTWSRRISTAHAATPRAAITRQRTCCTQHCARELGNHVQQKGSLVAPDRLRFDFAHFQPVTAEQLQRIERRVNEEIRANLDGETASMSYDEAVAKGRHCLVRRKIWRRGAGAALGDFSMELCGGTHVHRTGDIGLFKIVSESGVAAGIRRIEAVTGEGAMEYVAHTDELLAQCRRCRARHARRRSATRTGRPGAGEAAPRSSCVPLKTSLASGQGTDLASGALDIAGVKVVATQIDGADATALRNAVDQLKDKLKSAVIVLPRPVMRTRLLLVAGVTADLTARIKAGEIVGAVAAQVGGKGGGRPDFAQAGGTNAAALPAALASVHEHVRGKLQT
ncbi:MAG: DHHA1 domain-containing protein [Pseudomonadota bacterium]